MNVENIFLRPHKFLRTAMAIQTPAHLQSVCAPRQRHIAHRSVTRHAPHALIHVNTVIEIYKVRHGVHANPLNGLIVAIARPHWLQHRTIHPDLRMAGHASLRRRHSSRRRTLHRRVAVSAIQSKFADVMLVTERHRLVFRHIHICHIRRGCKLVGRPYQYRKHHNRAVNADARHRIRAAMKYLCHKSFQ